MEIFIFPPGVETRWSSFENPRADRGGGGKRNAGRKGAPSMPLAAGESRTLLDCSGSGTIRRIWMTIQDRSPEMLRGIRLDCYWDGAATPAVSVPLGDFFGVGLGRTARFESALFASPEARSFVSYVPMPFRTHARVVISNESGRDQTNLFYDINYTLEAQRDEALYFHAIFRRENPTVLSQDFEVLPRVHGRGRYLGANIGVTAPRVYAGSWWGEGEVKVYLDGDDTWPTLCGTGAEDYCSTGWGQGVFSQLYHGATIGDEANLQWAFYRYHIPDPVYFARECRVTLQQIGGAFRDTFLQLQSRGAVMVPVTANGKNLLETSEQLDVAALPEKSWINFSRQDDVSAAAYFYLDRAENQLPPLVPATDRCIGLIQASDTARMDG